MDFDEKIERRGTSCLKWDGTGAYAGIEGDDVLPMWVADMDFRAPAFIRDAMTEMVEAGIYAYMSDVDAMREAIAWWMKTRHGWAIDTGDILTCHGLGNGISLVIEALSEPGDGVVLFTPVYHVFAALIRAAGRRPVEVPMIVSDGRQEIDFDAADAALDGSESLVIACSPQNPGGRVWTEDELRAVAAFAERHDLKLVSDEVHHDLVYPGARFVPMEVATGGSDRLVTLTAPSKTFNIAGFRTGHMIVRDPGLRGHMQTLFSRRSIQPNMAGVVATAAAYSPDGADWVDALVAYLDGNRRAFDAGVNAIPGVRSTPLEATYLAWVDFSGTGMDDAEILDRVQNRARIAVNKGPSFGPGGECHMRFNFGTQRAHVDDAVARLHEAFSDLQ